MKKSAILLACVLGLAVTSLRAADAKTYQVTGPVLEVTPTYIVMQKGDEKWQVACDAATLGGAKAGDKVTVQYTVVAKKVEVKSDKGEKKMEKVEKKADKKADKK
jgi:RNase P/RNase MRP subunit p29